MNYDDIRDTLIRLPYPPDDGLAYALTDLFTVRHEIIRQLDPPPRSVFEFGALRGFFLVTAIDAAPSIERVGWVDNELHTPGSNQMCMDNVSAWARAQTERVNSLVSQYWTSRDVVRDGSPMQYDLIQVDSDHSVWGCLQDLRAAEKLDPRWIMVDDWTASSHRIEIREAVSVWLGEEDAAGRRWLQAEHETKNGLLLLTRA